MIETSDSLVVCTFFFGQNKTICLRNERDCPSYLSSGDHRSGYKLMSPAKLGQVLLDHGPSGTTTYLSTGRNLLGSALGLSKTRTLQSIT